MRYSGFPAKRTAALWGDVAAASSDLFNINTHCCQLMISINNGKTICYKHFIKRNFAD